MKCFYYSENLKSVLNCVIKSKNYVNGADDANRKFGLNTTYFMQHEDGKNRS